MYVCVYILQINLVNLKTNKYLDSESYLFFFFGNKKSTESYLLKIRVF